MASPAPGRSPPRTIPKPKSQTPKQQPSSSRTLRHDVEDRAVLLDKIRLRHALNVGGPQIQKDIDLRVGGPDVVVDDCRMGQVERLLLVGFASDDVVAHELILGALELAARDAVRLQRFKLRKHVALD